MIGQLAQPALSAVIDNEPLQRAQRVLELCRIEYRLLQAARGQLVIAMKPIPGALRANSQR